MSRKALRLALARAGALAITLTLTHVQELACALLLLMFSVYPSQWLLTSLSESYRGNCVFDCRWS